MKTVIEMAREAGFTPSEDHRTYIEMLEHFAELVRADEKEECAKVCEDEICNCCWDEQAGAVAEHLVAAIRARGNT